MTEGGPKTPSAAHWKAGLDGRVSCSLCFHRCSIAPGKAGACGARRNESGVLSLPLYGLASSIAVDPIEKKPLYHFLPGSGALSVGFFGCNLRCPFCQNWEISQEGPYAGSKRIEPSGLVDAALRAGTPSIAYTYSEPTVHFEFLLESMRLARRSGLRNVLVTNGSLLEGPSSELLSLTDAANIDLKCWSAERYERDLGGSLETVLAFIAIAARSCHVEVTTLVVPGLSDSADDIESIAAFLASQGSSIAFHLSAYHPAWRFEAPPTSRELLRELAGRARRLLPYVYVGNVSGGSSDTICPACGKTVIRRKAYAIEACGLEVSRGRASCSSCGASLPIIV